MSTSKKVVLIANFPLDRQESMQRFAQVLHDGFGARGHLVEVWRPEPYFTRLTSQYRYGGWPKYLGYLDKFMRFPRQIRRRLRNHSADTVYHIVDHANAVYAPEFARVPLAVTCHDLLQIRSARGEFPQNRLGRSGRRYQTWILDHLARLRVAVCVSQKTRVDLQRLTGLGDSATPVIYNGLNYPYRPMPKVEAQAMLRAAFARHEVPWPAAENEMPRYVFGIGGAQWYKNRAGLLAVFAAVRARIPSSPPRLVFVGQPFEPEQHTIISRYSISEYISHLPGLTNEELRAAYSLADGLLFPSWEEGFGWPIAEAQACGCPVFTSDRVPMTEVGGGAARYFDPAQPEAAAEVIVRGLAEADAMKVAGLREAQRWDPSHMLDGYDRVYHAIATGAPAPNPRLAPA